MLSEARRLFLLLGHLVFEDEEGRDEEGIRPLLCFVFLFFFSFSFFRQAFLEGAGSVFLLRGWVRCL